MLDLLRRELPASRVAGFEFRGVRPLFEGVPMTLRGSRGGSGIELQALNREDEPAMTVNAKLEDAEE